MALDATAGGAAADSYFTLTEATDYFTARGVTAWTSATDPNKEIAARKAATYLDNQYRGRWVGIRTNETQSLAWPRMGDTQLRLRDLLSYSLVDLDGYEIAPDSVPAQIKQAAMEAALLALTGSTLEPTLARGGAIKSISKTVGPLSKDITYEDGAPTIDRYTVIEGLLRGLVKSTPGARSGNVTLVRA